jgi:glycosyltransferase involved in cell wall biosynthesis
MAMHGPDAPELFDYLRVSHERYDLLVFFTYLYATTMVGLPIVAYKSILWPTAHDEPWIHLEVFRGLFQLPRGLVFNSSEEDRFVRQLFRNHHIPGWVVGAGIELPEIPAAPVLAEPYLIYLGRVDESKGCGELFKYYLDYKAMTGDPVKLVLVGRAAMPIPQHPDIVQAGFVGDLERFAWVQKADVLIMPSRFESLSLVTLEAMALGVPVLVNGVSAVLRAHCQQSQAGLYYANEAEFLYALKLLRDNAALRRRLGQRGPAYVRRCCNWRDITERYLAFLRSTYAQVYPGRGAQRMGLQTS